MKQAGGAAIYAFLDAARPVAGTQIAGMSSIGPSVAVVFDPATASNVATGARAALFAAAQRTGMQQSHDTAVNASGLRVTPVPAARLVLVIGKAFAGKTWLCEQAVVHSGTAGLQRVAHLRAQRRMRARQTPVVLLDGFPRSARQLREVVRDYALAIDIVVSVEAASDKQLERKSGSGGRDGAVHNPGSSAQDDLRLKRGDGG